MNDYTDERQSKILMFERWLKLMVQHRADERLLDCAITFSENPPQGYNSPRLEESRALPLPVALMAQQDAGAGGVDFLEQDIIRVPASDNGDGGGSDGHGARRYLQFAFMKRTFYMDLPKNTVWPEEARQLIARSPGFFYLRDGRFPWMSFESWQKTVREWNPLQKEYLNSDTRGAAEDMAYILFTLWRFPLDWQFYRRTLVFNGRKKRGWEGVGPVT